MKINRRKFCKCAVVSLGVSMVGGNLLIGCSDEEAGGLSSSLTLNTGEVANLKASGYFYAGAEGTHGANVFYNNSNGVETYSAFGSNCPHENKQARVQDAGTIKCSNHTEQTWSISSSGIISSGDQKTSANLSVFQATLEDDGTLTVSS